ncbi:transcription factor/nuclear export subunit protein 2-domain-containing protein [Lipomyces arxii]|uniref:transcription factor/nuclear export subunit protein 2-domain-containing protein n=1 Tax=Lipomyces arxii TaxID=56418 RepID=UPI0034CD995B
MQTPVQHSQVSDVRDLPAFSVSPPSVAASRTSYTPASGDKMADALGLSWLVLDDSIALEILNNEYQGLINRTKTIIDDSDTDSLYILFLELIQSSLNGKFTSDTVANASNSILSAQISGSYDLQSVLVDTLANFDYSQSLGSIIQSLHIDKTMLKLRMDPKAVVSLNLESSTFPKLVIKTVTNELFKQKRFNLLREESEGFAKFIVEIHAASYYPNNMSMVGRTSQNLVSIIGYFDLDPNRGLDIFLDLFAANIVANCMFFIALLKSMSWWPQKLASIASLDDLRQGGGNSVAASLLGYKLQSYTRENTPVPENLIMLIAVLVKEGFVSLFDIYPHFSPSDEDMLEQKDKWKKDLEESAFMATASALALAAPLQDDLTPQGTTNKVNESHPEQTQESTKNPAQLQKSQLVSSLLAVGALWPAVLLLTKFPFLPLAFPDVADIINLLMHHIIAPFYDSVRPFTPIFTNTLDDMKMFPQEHARQIQLVPQKPMSIRRVLNPLRKSDRADAIYRFFYDTWKSGLEQAINFDEFLQWSEVLLKFSGSQLSRDKVLFIKLCRLVNRLLDLQEHSDILLQYFRTYLLPPVSLVEPNPSVMHEIFRILSHFDYPVRCSIYGEWYTVLLKNQPELRVAAGKAEKETKNILKRLSKTNVNEMMRQLSRVSISNPVTSLVALVSQVESYDNLSDLVVTSARYFTETGWDALPFVILMQLASGRGTLQGDGVTERKWLQSLAAFTAKLCKEYVQMSPTPLLQYLQRQLHKSDSSDILLLQELLEQMAGIIPLTNLTDQQLEGLAAGRILKSEVLISIGDRRHLSESSAKRLLKSLLDHNLVSELFVLLAQQYKTSIFNIPEYMAHTKILSTRYDDLGVILLQYIEFLNTFLLHDKSSIGTTKIMFEDYVLDIPSLCNDFGIDPVVAFYLWREKLGLNMVEFDERRAQERMQKREEARQEELASVKDNNDVVMSETEQLVKLEDDATIVGQILDETKANAEATKKENSVTMHAKSLSVGELKTESLDSKRTEFADLDIEQVLDFEQDDGEIWHPLLVNIMDKLSLPMVPDLWEYVSTGLFVTFWQLSLSDIQMTLPRYSSELGRLREAIRVASDVEKSERNLSAIRIKQGEKSKQLQTMSKLNVENREQVTHFKKTLNRLRKEKDYWLKSKLMDAIAQSTDKAIRSSLPVERCKQMDYFISECLLSRALFSPVDAVFCAKFVKVLHTLNTPHWSTLLCFERLFVRSLEATVDACTPTEADNFGRFLHELLLDIFRWHGSIQAYERDCLGRKEDGANVIFLSGFCRYVGPSGISPPVAISPNGDLDAEAKSCHLLTYTEYKMIVWKWHRALTGALIKCLESREYMHRRNAIVVLKNLTKVFPKVTTMGKNILSSVEELSKNEEREDLKLAATTLVGILRRESTGWIDGPTFRATETQLKQIRDDKEALQKTEVEKKQAEERLAKQQAEAVKRAALVKAEEAKKDIKKLETVQKDQFADKSSSVQQSSSAELKPVSQSAVRSSSQADAQDLGQPAKQPSTVSSFATRMGMTPPAPVHSRNVDNGKQYQPTVVSTASAKPPSRPPLSANGDRISSWDVPRGPRSMNGNDVSAPNPNDIPLRARSDSLSSRSRTDNMLPQPVQSRSAPNSGPIRQPLPPQTVAMNRTETRGRYSNGYYDQSVQQFSIRNASSSRDTRQIVSKEGNVVGQNSVATASRVSTPVSSQASGGESLPDPRIRQHELSATASPFIPQATIAIDSRIQSEQKSDERERERERESDRPRDLERKHDRDRDREKTRDDMDVGEKDGSSVKGDSSHRHRRPREGGEHRKDHRIHRHRSKESDERDRDKDKDRDRSSRYDKDRESRHRDKDRERGHDREREKDREKDRERRRRDREERDRQRDKDRSGEGNEKSSAHEPRPDREDDRRRKHDRPDDGGTAENQLEEKRRRTES